MVAESRSRLRRLSWRLPLSIAGLLALAVAALSWMSYREVRGAVIGAAGERLESVARQLESLLARRDSGRLAALRSVAAEAVIREAVSAPGRDDVERVLDALDPLLVEGLEVGMVSLWDSGQALVAAASTAPPSASEAGRAPQPTFPAWAVGDTLGLSGFYAAEGAAWYDLAAPVLGQDGPLGYVVMHYRLSTSPEAVQLISDLIGAGVTFIVGQPGGTWTNLSKPVAGPPPASLEAAVTSPYESAAGRTVLGHGLPITATPWMVWVEFPLEAVLEPVGRFLARIVPLGILVVLASAAGGAALSRRITARLGDVRSAAAAIASGAYDRRAPTGSYAELDQLALAFNFMAEQVGDSQSRLEEQVAVRTAALEAREAEFRTLATTAPDAIVTADEDGLITYFNPGAERIFGRASPDVIGQPLTILMPERFRAAHRLGFSRQVATGNGMSGSGTRELVGRRHDGTEFPVELSLASWRHDGRMAFTGIIRDITDRLGREQAVRGYASELEAANRELEAFSYSVSHDLRAPLRAIHGFSQALAEDYEGRLDEQGVRLLDRVRAAAERMGLLIDDLLELSRATRAEMAREPIDLTELARGIAAELVANEPHRNVNVRVADGLVTTADPPLLKLVLANLIENAWKFTGKLEQAVIEVGLAEATSEFFVRDNGAGFDMAYVDKLFHPFQRLHPESEFKGTGVGLALVQRIVHRHGGRTRAEGNVGVGASFYFTLPAEAQQERRVET